MPQELFDPAAFFAEVGFFVKLARFMKHVYRKANKTSENRRGGNYEFGNIRDRSRFILITVAKYATTDE